MSTTKGRSVPHTPERSGFPSAVRGAGPEETALRRPCPAAGMVVRNRIAAKPVATVREKARPMPLHPIYDCVQCSAGPHRCDTLVVVREIVPPNVHWFALRRQQLLRDLALGRRQRGGYRREALL
jgi:hypothetical protein